MARSISNSNFVKRTRDRGWIPFVIAVGCIGLCFLNWSRLSGMEYGYFYGVFNDPPSGGFAAHGPNYFQSMNLWYFVIIICFSIYSVLSIFGSQWGASAIRILATSAAIVPYYGMLDYKFYLADRWSRYGWVETSFYIDIACAVVVLSLLGRELIHTTRSAASVTEIPLSALNTETKVNESLPKH